MGCITREPTDFKRIIRKYCGKMLRMESYQSEILFQKIEEKVSFRVQLGDRNHMLIQRVI